MKNRFHLIFTILIISSLFFPINAQLGLPQVEEVYGGRITDIEVVALNPVTSRIFITTESANSMFYADVDHSSGTPVFGAFTTIADVDTNDGFGKNIESVRADGASGQIFFTHQRNIYSVSTTAGSLSMLNNSVLAIETYDGNLYFVKEIGGGLELHFGAINPASGVFSEHSDSPISIASSFSTPPQQNTAVRVNPANDSIYVFLEGSPSQIFCSNTTYNSLTSASLFTELDTTGLGVADNYRSFGIAPDGRLYIGGRTGVEPNHFKRVAFSDNNGASWDTLRVPFGGTDGPNIECAGSGANYSVMFGSNIGVNRGENPTDWNGFGWNGFETHANDGTVACDPLNPNVVYMTTDQGIGASTDRGETIFEIDEGVEAVQVNDFDMNTAKTIGWTASKSGIRRVENYASASENWRIMFPMGDGSPYYSIAMDQSDSTGNTAYAGNVRVYKTTDGGFSWDRIFDVQDPSWGFSFWSYISSIKIHPENNEVVIIGVNSPDNGVKGGIFWTEDGGSTWDKLDTTPYNTEVLDFEFVYNSDSTTTIYVACEYVSDGTSSSYGVKTITYDPSVGVPVFENSMIGETGTVITNFGARDLAHNDAGDIFVAGNNGATDEPRVYVKYADSTHWEMLPTATLPGIGRVPAITVGETPDGNQTPFIAVDSNIYYLDVNTWKLGFSYPIGMDINVLFWDDLLVGTGTGLYGHFFNSTTGLDDKRDIATPNTFHLTQNFPNPFNPKTTIRYEIPFSARVKLSIFNIAGQEVDILVNEMQPANTYSVSWNAGKFPSGVYFYRLETFSANPKNSNFSEVRKMILLK